LLAGIDGTLLQTPSGEKGLKTRPAKGEKYFCSLMSSERV